MTPAGTVTLNDWGGTYEIKRDGRGCGIDACLPATAPVTMLEQKFDGKTLLAATGEIIKTTRYATMPHCESAALLRFDDLEGFVADISREHVVLVFGDYIEELSVLAGVLGLDLRVYRG